MENADKIDLLLVEDEPADIYLIEQAIADCSPHGQVWQVANGAQALAFLHQAPPFENVPPPALMRLDLHIPGRDGYAVLAELRALAPSRTLPVIVISGLARRIEEPRCRELGATAYVEKSPDFDTYFSRISGHDAGLAWRSMLLRAEKHLTSAHKRCKAPCITPHAAILPRR